jgi:hypothetical protein
MKGQGKGRAWHLGTQSTHPLKGNCLVVGPESDFAKRTTAAGGLGKGTAEKETKLNAPIPFETNQAKKLKEMEGREGGGLIVRDGTCRNASNCLQWHLPLLRLLPFLC